MDFETNIFINCPFDARYLEILRPILFGVVFLGFTPRIALERLDSGEPRIQKIIRLIAESKYAIHDLSRIRAERKGEFFRLNMPFELGLDVGCRLYKDGVWSQKQCLILEAERYRYQAAISDLAASDIAVHNDEPQTALSEVRNWLSDHANLSPPGPAAVWGRFLDFMADNYNALTARGYSDQDIKNLPVTELITCMQSWMGQSSEA